MDGSGVPCMRYSERVLTAKCTPVIATSNGPVCKGGITAVPFASVETSLMIQRCPPGCISCYDTKRYCTHHIDPSCLEFCPRVLSRRSLELYLISRHPTARRHNNAVVLTLL